MDQIDVKVENISLRFRLANEKVDNLKEFVLRKMKRKMGYRDHYALKEVSFEIQKGERVGIIGHNGAGKSTLLKIIAGVLKPTSGKMFVNGNVAPLLELGAGFDPEFSGAENIYLNGAILGKSKTFLDDRFKDIVEFSELEEFIHVPLKNYSSGMRARLGFSIATQIEPDILIVDEILGVGDQRFKEKSSKKMLEMMKDGKTVLLVSHSIEQIEKLTERTIWLEKGMIKEIGKTDEICKNYKKYMKK